MPFGDARLTIWELNTPGPGSFLAPSSSCYSFSSRHLGAMFVIWNDHRAWEASSRSETAIINQAGEENG